MILINYIKLRIINKKISFKFFMIIIKLFTFLFYIKYEKYEKIRNHTS